MTLLIKVCGQCWWHDRVGSRKPDGCCLSFLLWTGLWPRLLSNARVEDWGHHPNQPPFSCMSVTSQILNVPWLETSVLFFVMRGTEGCCRGQAGCRSFGESWGAPWWCTRLPTSACWESPRPCRIPNPETWPFNPIPSGWGGDCCPCCVPFEGDSSREPRCWGQVVQEGALTQLRCSLHSRHRAPTSLGCRG